MLVLAPKDEPARHLSRLFQDVSLAQSASVCCLYVSCWSSFTPQYRGNGLCGSGVPVQVDRKLVFGFPVVQMEWCDCSLSQTQFECPCTKIFCYQCHISSEYFFLHVPAFMRVAEFEIISISILMRLGFRDATDVLTAFYIWRLFSLIIHVCLHCHNCYYFVSDAVSHG